MKCSQKLAQSWRVFGHSSRVARERQNEWSCCNSRNARARWPHAVKRGPRRRRRAAGRAHLRRSVVMSIVDVTGRLKQGPSPILAMATAHCMGHCGHSSASCSCGRGPAYTLQLYCTGMGPPPPPPRARGRAPAPRAWAIIAGRGAADQLSIACVRNSAAYTRSCWATGTSMRLDGGGSTAKTYS